MVGVASLVLAATKFVDFNRGAPANPVSAFLQNHINLVIFAQLPILAMFGKLLFREEKLNFAEHLALAAYASAFRSIFFTLVIIPAWLAFNWHYPTTVAVYLGLWVAYYGIASAQFHSGNRWWLWVKGALVPVFTQLLAFAIISGAIWVWFAFFKR